MHLLSVFFKTSTLPSSHFQTCVFCDRSPFGSSVCECYQLAQMDKRKLRIKLERNRIGVQQTSLFCEWDCVLRLNSALRWDEMSAYGRVPIKLHLRTLTFQCHVSFTRHKILIVVWVFKNHFKIYETSSAYGSYYNEWWARLTFGLFADLQTKSHIWLLRVLANI